jgi:1-acyl-sn-glycerol-3-phosphate acyltransferase
MKEYAPKTKRSWLFSIVYFFIRSTIHLFFETIYRIRIIGVHNIPKRGRLILCSNHVSYLDPVILGGFFPRQIYYMAKSEVFKNNFLASLVSYLNTFPVNRNSFDRKAIRYSVSILNSENVLGIFPEGTRAVDGIMKEGQSGVGLISVLTKSPILPVAISGTNKIVQKPRKRLFFPMVKIAYGELIETKTIIENNDNKTAIEIIVKKTMNSIKDLYDLLNPV